MREYCKSTQSLVKIGALGALIIWCQPVIAARPLPRFDVWIDGKAALKAFAGRRGEDADTLWQHLKTVEFEPAAGRSSHRIEPDVEDPLRATLKGNVVIYVEEGGRADVSELKLVRRNENSRWMIVPEVVDRTLKTRHKPFLIVVSVNGRPELSTGIVTRTGRTLDSPDNVWQRLKPLSVIPIRGQMLQTDEDDSLHATLTGKVVIELKYDGQPWGRSEVSSLKLFRQNVKARRWQVDPADVDRTFSNRTGNQADGRVGGGAPEDVSKGGPSSIASGNWAWTAGRTQMTLRLHQEAKELTGALIANNGPETVIEDGKCDDGRISFKVSHQEGKAEVTAEYAGTVSRDTINGGLRVYIGPRPKTMPAKPVPWQARRAAD